MLVEGMSFNRIAVRGSVRVLEAAAHTDVNTEPDTLSAQSNSSDSFRVFMSVVVALFAIGYIVCIVQIFKSWFYRVCLGLDVTLTERPLPEPQEAAVDLNRGQRRAVLEAIFSANSKAVTEDDVCDRNKKRRERRELQQSASESVFDEGVPADVEVPVGLNDLSQDTEDDDSISDTDTQTESSEHRARLPYSSSASFSRPSGDSETAADRHEIALGSHEGVDPCSCTAGAVEEGCGREVTDAGFEAQQQHESALELVLASRNDEAGGERALEGQNTSVQNDAPSGTAEIPINPPTSKTPTSASVPENATELPDLRPTPDNSSCHMISRESEEAKEEVACDDASEALTRSDVFTMVHMDAQSIHTMTTSSDNAYDDETEDHMCAICLDGYKEGDQVIASKHCSHLFHKDCILEWLTAEHDECPCCRVNMVTEGEINQAATSLVGVARTRTSRSGTNVRNAPSLASAFRGRPNHLYSPNALYAL